MPKPGVRLEPHPCGGLYTSVKARPVSGPCGQRAGRALDGHRGAPGTAAPSAARGVDYAAWSKADGGRGSGPTGT